MFKKSKSTVSTTAAVAALLYTVRVAAVIQSVRSLSCKFQIVCITGSRPFLMNITTARDMQDSVQKSRKSNTNLISRMVVRP